MEAKDLLQRGDVFANKFAEYTVISVESADRVKVENMAGMTEFVSARHLIELGAKETGKNPANA